MLAWTFGREITTRSGDVDLKLEGNYELSSNAVTFDGHTGFATSMVAAPVATTSSFSVSAWVSLGESVEFAAAVSQAGVEAGAFFLGIANGTWDFTMKDADTNLPGHSIRAAAPARLVDLDRWVHLVGVHDRDNGEIRLYVDGKVAGSIAFDAPWQAEGELTIGRAQAHFAPADFWPGSIASVAIYAEAITVEQVRSIQDATTPTEGPPGAPSVASKLHGTWDYVLEDAGRAMILNDFAGLVDGADEVAVRLAFDDNDWWLGFLFDGELFLLDGVPEGDGGTFTLGRDKLVTTGYQGKARVTYDVSIDDESLSLTAVEECAVSGDQLTCNTDRSTMDPLMLLVTDQTFTRSGDDPSY
jgi:hypothetical protein